MIFIAFFSLIIAGAILRGITDAILYSRKGADAFPWNEHIVLTIDTIVICVGFAAGTLLEFNWVFLGFLAAAFWPSFSFFHNGVYNVTKNAIFKTGMSFFEAWTDTSKTSTAKHKFDFKSRLYLLLFGLLILTIGHIVL
jgi:hypothetical protein